MKKLWSLFLTVICLLNLNVPLLAQSDDPTAACGVIGCGIVVYLLVLLAILAGSIALIVFIIKWIKKDATMRGMPNADSIKWLGLLGLLGLVIYLVQRPSGNMPPPNYPPRR